MIKSLKNKVRGNKLLPFLFFLFVSCCLWLLQVMNEKFETDIPFSVYVDNVPDGIDFEEGDHAEMRVLLRDNGAVLFGYELSERPAIRIDYSELKDNNGCMTIPSSELKSEVMSHLETTTSLVQFLNETVTFNVKRVAKEVPVKVNIDVKPSAKFSFEYDYEPKMVTVAATSDVVEQLDSVGTELLSDILLDEDKIVRVQLVADKNVKIAPRYVDVNFHVYEMQEKCVSVPLNLVGFPDEYPLPDVPDYVDITFNLPDTFKDKVKPGDFVVELSYYEYENAKSDSVPLSVVSSLPSYVKDVSCSPSFIKK